jgi:hypothetical protein
VDEDGQTTVSLSEQATAARLKLPQEERERLMVRLGELALHPERSVGVPGSFIRRAIFKTVGGDLYNLVFAVDERMSRHLPAIVVSSITPLGARRGR